MFLYTGWFHLIQGKEEEVCSAADVATFTSDLWYPLWYYLFPFCKRQPPPCSHQECGELLILFFFFSILPSIFHSSIGSSTSLFSFASSSVLSSSFSSSSLGCSGHGDWAESTAPSLSSIYPSSSFVVDESIDGGSSSPSFFFFCSLFLMFYIAFLPPPL